MDHFTLQNVTLKVHVRKCLSIFNIVGNFISNAIHSEAF